MSDKLGEVIREAVTDALSTPSEPNKKLEARVAAALKHALPSRSFSPGDPLPLVFFDETRIETVLETVLADWTISRVDGQWKGVREEEEVRATRFFELVRQLYKRSR